MNGLCEFLNWISVFTAKRAAVIEVYMAYASRAYPEEDCCVIDWGLNPGEYELAEANVYWRISEEIRLYPETVLGRSGSIY